ncbi:Zn-dependent peptidase ImmA (M78 family) [Natronocella acetinitrilica]|uniref:Zn-dependent peptidase ImmA (M78 family) n=1 Tax=Natronocella acetinitrilica TaxID=414046 RepID=A0AAE3G5Y1_9GAMM|nr:Zn-dependent peptidase ImmA (M78 family) [Natronocella acetinitrilica]
MSPLRPAEQLLQSLGVTQPQEIDLEAIAYDQGAIVKYRPLEGCEARIVGFGERAIITVDNRALPSRVRFSTAHELGHWQNHRGRSLICRAEDIGNARRRALDPERIADNYAADWTSPGVVDSS